MYLILGAITLSNNDRILIQDCWERIDSAADRAEPECRPASWDTYDCLKLTVDSNGDIWHDGLLLAYREDDHAVVVGSLERVKLY